MDFLISIRQEWNWGFHKGYTDLTCKEWGFGIFIGPVCVVVTNVRLLEDTNMRREV
jgi:hypothetical protein